MTYEHILAEREDGVGILTLNRPDVLNAMNRKLGVELLDAVKILEADDAIGCLVITGAGDKAFSAGGGIKERSEEHTSELPSQSKIVFPLLLVKKKKNISM